MDSINCSILIWSWQLVNSINLSTIRWIADWFFWWRKFTLISSLYLFFMSKMLALLPFSQILVETLQDGLSLFYTLLFAGLIHVEDHFIWDIVIDTYACAVTIAKTVDKRIEGKRMNVRRTEYIPAESIVLMRETKLPEESGRQVSLIHNLTDDHRFAYGSSCHNQRNPVISGTITFSLFFFFFTMIREEDD